MVIKGAAYTKNPQNRWEYFLKYGIATHSRSVGNMCYTPLGVLVKTKMCNKLENSLQDQFDTPLTKVELPVVLSYKEVCDAFFYRECSSFLSNGQEKYYYCCDPVSDVNEAEIFLTENQYVYWQKKYMDLSARVKPTGLRFHSYELLCILTNKDITTFTNNVSNVLANLFGIENIYKRHNSDNDFSIRFSISDREDFTIAHIHEVPNNPHRYICGIPIEKLVYAMLIYNQCCLNERIILFEKVLAVYKEEAMCYDEFDFVDARNLKIKLKSELLQTIGVKKIYLLSNTKTIKEYI